MYKFLAKTKEIDALPGLTSLPYMCPLRGLFSVTFFTFLGFWLVTLLFKMDP